MELLSFYVQKLEMLFFFSGYPLLYAIVISISANKASGNSFRSLMSRLLPYSYALTGTLYLGLQLRNIYYGRMIAELDPEFQPPWLVLWALLSILCWVPAIAKIKVASLLHSLVFLLLIIKDIILQSTGGIAMRDILRNDMVIYTGSLILNIFCLLTILMMHAIIFRNRIHKTTPRS